MIPAVLISVIFLLLYFFVTGVRERPWTVDRMAGAALAATGYVLSLVARQQLGKSFSVMPKATELVTHGLFPEFAIRSIFLWT